MDDVDACNRAPPHNLSATKSTKASSHNAISMGTLSSRPLPRAVHRACTRVHIESAQRAWTESGPLGAMARARLADILARACSWPDTLLPLCDAPLPGNVRPDTARYPFAVPLVTVPPSTTSSRDNNNKNGADLKDKICHNATDKAEKRVGGVDGGDDGANGDDKEEEDEDEPATRGPLYEAACAALWHYVRVVLPELEVHPRCAGSDIYDAPDRLRIMLYMHAPQPSTNADGPSPSLPQPPDANVGTIWLAYGFATTWEAGALQRAAAFLAARRKRRAMQSPRPLARTGWLSARGIKPDAVRASGNMAPHPRLVRDPRAARSLFTPHRFDDDDDDDDEGDDEIEALNRNSGFHVAFRDRLSTKTKRVSKDDSQVARERDPYNIRNPPALWWRQQQQQQRHRNRLDPMDIEERDREGRRRSHALAGEDSETDLDPIDDDDHIDVIDLL